MENFTDISQRLSATLDEALPMLRKIAEDQAGIKPQPRKWSKKEIIGHLLDSASNNHQRFTRAAIEGKLDFPAYDQDPLVALERFQEMRWEELLQFWEGYNRFLAHLIAGLPQARAATQCIIGDHNPATLEWLASDYVEHLKHHLNQIVGRRWTTTYQPPL
jgi:hypothetical protein